MPDRPTIAFTAASVPDNYERHLAPVIFAPWAEILLDWAGLPSGARVLDVASGTGVVARAAARRVGPDGHVTATDVSGPMLARGRAAAPQPGAAPIDFVPAAADELPFADASFDAVVCQQGLQFFPDRASALTALVRVMRPGAPLALAVWASGHRLEPLDDFGQALRAAGVPEPFPGAFTRGAFAMAPEQVQRLLTEAGAASVEVTVRELVLQWPSADAIVAAIAGTPFGPVFGGLPAEQRERVEAELLRLSGPGAPGEPVARSTVAVLARATA